MEPARRPKYLAGLSDGPFVRPDQKTTCSRFESRIEMEEGGVVTSARRK